MGNEPSNLTLDTERPHGVAHAGTHLEAHAGLGIAGVDAQAHLPGRDKRRPGASVKHPLALENKAQTAHVRRRLRQAGRAVRFGAHPHGVGAHTEPHTGRRAVQQIAPGANRTHRHRKVRLQRRLARLVQGQSTATNTRQSPRRQTIAQRKARIRIEARQRALHRAVRRARRLTQGIRTVAMTPRHQNAGKDALPLCIEAQHPGRHVAVHAHAVDRSLKPARRHPTPRRPGRVGAIGLARRQMKRTAQEHVAAARQSDCISVGQRRRPRRLTGKAIRQPCRRSIRAACRKLRDTHAADSDMRRRRVVEPPDERVKHLAAHSTAKARDPRLRHRVRVAYRARRGAVADAGVARGAG